MWKRELHQEALFGEPTVARDYRPALRRRRRGRHIPVQPKNVVGQIGGVIYGTRNALYERVSVKEGRVEQSNVHDYAVIRMADVPEMLDADRYGRSAVFRIAPVIANTFAALTGQRLRHE